MHRIVTVRPFSFEDAQRQLAEMEAQYAADAAVRRAESEIALRRWAEMRGRQSQARWMARASRAAGVDP